MKNTYNVMVEGIYGVRNARSFALRKCVHEHDILNHEFMRVTTDILKLSTDEYIKRVGNFIREKGLRIISEKPVVRTKNDRYVVDVYFTIAW